MLFCFLAQICPGVRQGPGTPWRTNGRKPGHQEQEGLLSLLGLIPLTLLSSQRHLSHFTSRRFLESLMDCSLFFAEERSDQLSLHRFCGNMRLIRVCVGNSVWIIALYFLGTRDFLGIFHCVARRTTFQSPFSLSCSEWNFSCSVFDLVGSFPLLLSRSAHPLTLLFCCCFFNSRIFI